MLKFNVLRSKTKGVRVHVYRRSATENKTSSQRYKHKEIGIFTLSEGCPASLLEQLDSHELILMENFMAEVEFSKDFGVEADQNDKFDKITLRVPRQVSQFVEKHLYPATKQTSVWFNPAKYLLESYKKGIESAVKKVSRIQNTPSLLEEARQAGLALTDDRAEIGKDRLIEETRSLFKALIKLKQPIEKTCEEFEKCIEKHGKKKNVSPAHLQCWAGETSNQEYQFKNWYISIAIEVLLQHSINLRPLLPIDKIARYWTLTHKEILNLKTAQATFADLLKVKPEELPIVNATILNAYKKTSVKTRSSM